MKVRGLALVAFTVLSIPKAFAEIGCLGIIEDQVLQLAESQVRAKGIRIQKSRLTVLHYEGCTGWEDDLSCAVNSKVAVQGSGDEWYYYTFQSAYPQKRGCSAPGSMTTKQKSVVEGLAAKKAKMTDDGLMLDLIEQK